AVAGLVGEFAEVDLPGMARTPQHEDVGARAEDPVLRAGDDDRAHPRMLEPDAIEGIVQLDVHAEVVAVELQLVAGPDSAVFCHFQLQPRDLAVHRETPVPVLVWIRAIVDPGGAGGVRSAGVITHVHLLWRGTGATARASWLWCSAGDGARPHRARSAKWHHTARLQSGQSAGRCRILHYPVAPFSGRPCASRSCTIPSRRAQVGSGSCRLVSSVTSAFE